MMNKSFVKKYQFISVDELASMLDVCEATVYNWIRKNKLKAYKFGKHYKFLEDDIIEFLQNCAIEPIVA